MKILRLRPRLRWAVAMCAAGAVWGSAAMAADKPPRTYRLDEAELQIDRMPAHGLPKQRLLLVSQRESRLETGGKAVPFQLPPQELLAAINALHGIRFFQMPASFGPRTRVALGEDGTVITQVLAMADTLSTTVCFTVPGYRKCVTYRADPPPGLEELVQRLFADATHRAGVDAPGK